MRVYLAAAYTRRFELREHRDELWDAAGITVTSSWIDQDFADDAPDEDALADYARMDLAEVETSDIAVFFTDQPSTRGGMWVELGYALSEGLDVFVVGAHVNVFTRLADWVFASWDEALADLKAEAS